MIIVTTATKAKGIFAKYDTNIAAFTAGKTKAIDDADLQVSLTKLNILPDEDEINGVVNGDLKAKKVIKRAKKALLVPSMENNGLCIEMAQLVNIISSDRKLTKREVKNIKKHGPNIIVIVLDDPTDEATKQKNKFLTKYLAEIFGTFGIDVITDTKVLKKLFKGKSKKVVNRVANFIRANDKVRVSGKGLKLKKRLFGFFAIELRQAALFNLAQNDGELHIRKEERRVMLKNLLDAYTNDNFIIADGLDKKQTKKICGSLKQKNKVAVAAYESFCDILNTAMGTDMKLPKVKNGYDKKGKAPKMKVKKFVKYFEKKKNFDFIPMIYAHTSAVLCDVAIGSKEYNKIMSTMIGYMNYEDTFSKAFIAAAKALKTTEETK